jgi:hypothetical protein
MEQRELPNPFYLTDFNQAYPFDQWRFGGHGFVVARRRGM